MGEFDEIFMFGAITNDKKRAVGRKASFDGKIDALPCNLAARDDEGSGLYVHCMYNVCTMGGSGGVCGGR